MAKWDRRVDPQFDLSESDHEGGEDDSSTNEDDDKNGPFDKASGSGGGLSNSGNGSNSQGSPKDLGGSSGAFGASGGQSTSSYPTNIMASATHFGDANSGSHAGTINGAAGVAYSCSSMEDGGGSGGCGFTKTGATGPPSRPQEFMNRFLSEPDDACPWTNLELVLTGGLVKPLIDLDHLIRNNPPSDFGEEPMLSDFMSSLSLEAPSVALGHRVRGVGDCVEEERPSPRGLAYYMSVELEAVLPSSMTSVGVTGAQEYDIVHGVGYSSFLRLN